MELVETARLRLERWTTAQSAMFAAINAQPAVARFVNGGVLLTRSQSDAASAAMAEHWDTYGFGLWAVHERESGAMIGFAGLVHPRWFPQEQHLVEVGWRLDSRAWGRGYATEAGQAALDAGFSSLGLERIVAYIHPGNARSRAVAARLGLRLGREVPHPARRHPMYVYERTSPERCPMPRTGRPHRL